MQSAELVRDSECALLLLTLNDFSKHDGNFRWELCQKHSKGIAEYLL